MAADVITIHHVARRAGVSASTVSNYLNGRMDRMRPETRTRVEEAIRELGYAPNQVARELKTGIVPIIGLIVPSVANPFWGAFARSVELAAEAKGYQVLLCNSERDLAREQRYAEALLARGIRGVIFGSSPLSMDHLYALVERGLQAVAFDRRAQRDDRLQIDSVRVDNRLGAELVVNHLLALGHRRIGFVSGPVYSVNRLERLSGYRNALIAAGLAPDPDLIWTSEAGEGAADTAGTETGCLGARQLLTLPDPPTAIFGVNDMTALGVYTALREAGRQVGGDVSVVGFDDIGLARVVEPGLTTVHQPLDELMHAAVELLISRLEEPRGEPPADLMLKPWLVIRSSSRPRSPDKG